MKVGIIGLGMVGNAVREYFKEKHEIIGYDILQKETSLKNVYENADLAFICVPTPMSSVGKADTSAVEEIALQWVRFGNGKPLIIKSTVPVGFTDSQFEKYKKTTHPKLNIFFNPEFLRERFNVQDMKDSKTVYIGINIDELKDSPSEALKTICNLYYFTNPDIELYILQADEAELLKYSTNVLLACQVGIANEIFNIACRLGISFPKIVQFLKKDERIGKYLDVPGYDGLRGFGGTCFPKDLNSLIFTAREHGYRSYLLEEIWRSNLVNRNGETK